MIQDYDLWTAADCDDTQYETGHRSWFYYGVSGHARGDFATFNILNMNKQSKLYSQDYRPMMWNQSMGQWERIKLPVS